MRDLNEILRATMMSALALAFIGEKWSDSERDFALDTLFATAFASDMHEWDSPGWRAQILSILATLDLARERGWSPTWAISAIIGQPDTAKAWFAAHGDDLEARLGRITLSGRFDAALEAANRVQREVREWVSMLAEVRHTGGAG
jgi:hypothetical protein